MARSRTDLQTLLESLAEGHKVYFQPPTGARIEYPCIIYKLDSANTRFANDAGYIWNPRYQVTLITQDPDSGIPKKFGRLAGCLFNRSYTADGLYHHVFNLYF